jgi:XTP/dITP diphosphohydrolase
LTCRRRPCPDDPEASANKIVVASHNPGKVREIADLLRPLGIETVSAGELDLPEPEETETTFEGNARLKAEAAAKGFGSCRAVR